MFKVNINFDEASEAWRANKINLNDACHFIYRCKYIHSDNTICKKGTICPYLRVCKQHLNSINNYEDSFYVYEKELN